METPARNIQAVLFVCNFNAVRSVMAEAVTRHYFGRSLYVQSAGVRKMPLDGFVIAVLDEIGIDANRHRPKTLVELEDWEGLNFDLIVSLTPEAHHAAMDLTRLVAADVEYWPSADPGPIEGTREQILDRYRALRDSLIRKITARFRA
ncbi:MAG: low molecular weight phosphatase family protein [Beijerinckiaceae bacterium]